VPAFGVVHGAAVVHVAEIWSQPELVVAMEKVPAVPAPEIVTIWGAGLGPPATYSKDIVVGVAETTGKPAAAVPTTMVTFSVCVPEDETIEIVPLQVVPVANPD
jgi:hypothetical protein